MSDYHIPVLLRESIDLLITNPDGLYMDLTFGGGGHSREILSRLSAKGRLIVFDQDEESQDKLPDDKRISFVKSNFRYIYRYWKWLNPGKAQGILADLGVSSHQFDADYRGFSYRYNSELDMRMNEKQEFTASDLLNTYDAARMQDVFSRYGEIRNSRTLAKAIVEYREQRGAIKTTEQLNEIAESMAFGDRIRYLSQVYQAIRIEVNGELEALAEMLDASLRILAPGGRLVVISYHSLEDRMVKKFMKTGNVEGKIEKDEYGRWEKPIRMIGKLVLPSKEEQEINSRSRSAKMRTGQKI